MRCGKIQSLQIDGVECGEKNSPTCPGRVKSKPSTGILLLSGLVKNLGAVTK
jgi:hypothetical protein